MARKRLTPPQDMFLTSAPAPAAAAPAPIAHIAGDAAAMAALRELGQAMDSARAEGRLVQNLPLDAIEVDHLIRDRIAADAEEMAALKASLLARGQQQPIDVVDLGTGRYGLISGWRRLSALRELFQETGEARFGSVLALLRRPEGASDAYLAMVEENEIRLGLSHYERARIAALAADQGVFASPQEALRALFAHASRAKRSKIGSFITLHRALGDALRFPAAIPERLGLALAQAIEADAAFGPRLAADLLAHPAASAAEETARLARALKPAKTGSAQAESAKEIRIDKALTERGLRVTLTGSGVTEALVQRLAVWLSKQG
jgi:ParB-like chromosome segregation protein Spo0J